MKRCVRPPRANWEERVEAVGLVYHTPEMPYWDESTYYTFSMHQIDELEATTNDLHQMCLQAAQYIIDQNLFDRLSIPEWLVAPIIDAWEAEPPALYGRFDLAYDGRSKPKLLEYNADTPTSLLEAAVVQWHWLEDVFPYQDQFNSIHDKLIAKWRDLVGPLGGRTLYFGHTQDVEDTFTAAYLRDTAQQAGLRTASIAMSDIGWNTERQAFVDLDERRIDAIFKLYPWEWLVAESFGRHAIDSLPRMYWIEPLWKMLLSNKGLLAVLWEMFPRHPNLLECYFEDDHRGRLRDFVRKPLLSREGANVSLHRHGEIVAASSGDYGAEGHVRQAIAPLFEHEGRYAVLGSWVIDQEAAGVGIRESNGPITDNRSRFVPHVIG